LFLRHKAASVDEFVGVSVEERRNWTIEESIAEVFAAFFLMPAGLLRSSLDELGTPALTPETVYLLALKMGTSYLATVNHLQTLKKLAYPQAKAFRNLQPQVIKSRLSECVSGRHDVWVLDEHWNGQPIFPAVEDTVVMRLQEIPTSGYAWVWDKSPDGLRVLEDGFADAPSGEVGGSRVREFVTEVTPTAVAERISLGRRQPWDSESRPSAQFAVDLFPQQVRKSGPLIPPSFH
jgi:predicted secreted protein